MIFTRRSAATQILQLRSSRRAIVQAFEIERRRIERDLHDGAQQYLVAANMAIGEAHMILDLLIQQYQDSQYSTSTLISPTIASSPAPDTASITSTSVSASNISSTPALPSTLTTTLSTSSTGANPDLLKILTDLRTVLDRAQKSGEEGLKVLRATVNNIHPNVLANIGLEAAVRALAERSSIHAKVVVPHPLPTMPEGVAATAYFFTAEALTNAAKYAPNAQATILLAADNDLHISIVDEGPGGAVILPGHGLSGLQERLAAFGGNLHCDSPPGGPTTVAASIPLLLNQGESGVAA